MNVHIKIMKSVVNPILLVGEIQSSTGWSPHRIAEEAGISHTTLSRNLKKPADEVTFNSATVSKLLALADRVSVKHAGMDEPEVLPLGPPDDEEWQPNLQKWQINSDSMILAGLLPGDEITANSDLTPKNGDIVVAQITDFEHDTTQTVIRRYYRSSITYITAASTRIEENELVLVDNNAVVIMAVMQELARHRAG